MRESHLHIDDLFMFHLTFFNSSSEIARAKKMMHKIFFIYFSVPSARPVKISDGAVTRLFICVRFLIPIYVHQLKWRSEFVYG